MDRKRIHKKEIIRDEAKNESSQKSLVDSFKNMVDLFVNPAKSAEYEYETKQTIINSYTFIYLSIVVALFLLLLPSLNIFGIITGALVFLFYVFFMLFTIIAGSSFVWLSARILDVKSDFERQTNSILMFSTVSILLIILIEIIASLLGSVIASLQLLVFIYGAYGLISIVKNTNKISWVKSLIIVGWPILIFLISYIFLYVMAKTIMPYDVSFQ